MLEMKLVSLNLNGRYLYKDLMLTVPNGSSWLWQGPSGIGKSVLAQMCCGLVRPTSGEILIDQKRIFKPNLDSFYVSQNDDLFFWQTLRQHVDFLNSLQDCRPISQEVLDVFKLDKALDLYPNELSGGMKKRLQLLRSLSFKRRLVILDETLSAIDHKLRDQILSFLFSIWKPDNTTVICISHQNDPELSAYFSKQLYFPIASNPL